MSFAHYCNHSWDLNISTDGLCHKWDMVGGGGVECNREIWYVREAFLLVLVCLLEALMHCLHCSCFIYPIQQIASIILHRNTIKMYLISLNLRLVFHSKIWYLLWTYTTKINQLSSEIHPQRLHLFTILLKSSNNLKDKIISLNKVTKHIVISHLL